MPTPPPNSPPPEHPMDTPRAIIAQGLKFGGLILTCAGAAALIRTGEHSLFYVSLMPIGLALWFVGFRTLGKIADEVSAQNPPQQNNQSPQN